MSCSPTSTHQDTNNIITALPLLIAEQQTDNNNTSHAPTTPYADPNSNATLSPGAKAGIIVSVTVFILILSLLLFEYGYMRTKRRERAIQRAIEEVERGGGMEMAKRVHSQPDESKENMVLESRVEIVVQEEEESESEDGWEADAEEDEEWREEVREVVGRGRMGMSLPRVTE